jgi:hypothetical protein
MSRHSLISELRRRNVHRAAVFYAGAAWLLVQIATQVFPFFHVDEAVVRWIVIAAIVGFPFAMRFSWFYEWTPQGIKLESEIDRAASVTPQTGEKIDKAVIAVLSLAVVLLLANSFMPRSAKAPAGGDKSIAVLPFVNMSTDAENEFFSDGLSEEILNSLARIDAVQVVGRTPAGGLLLAVLVTQCQCGAPFDLDATPNFKARLAESGLRRRPPTTLQFPPRVAALTP